jgi:glutathione S-transferase
MITVHHLEDSRSQRILWLLEELGLPYEVVRYERDPVTRLAPPALTAIHPLGKSPVVTDGDLTVAETGAIIEYIVGRYGEGRLIPAAGTLDRLRYTYWLHYAEGTIMALMVMKLIFDTMAVRAPGWAKPLVKAVTKPVLTGYVGTNIAKNLKFIEAELTAFPWFAGADFTAADIMMSFPLEAAGSRVPLDGAPHITAFVKTVQARPAYQKALARGGPYAFGPK